MKPGTAYLRRGDLFWADLNPIKGSEQAGRRPVVILQNNVLNDRLETTIVAPVTTKVFSKEFPTNVFLPKGAAGLKIDSTILLHQIRTIDKSRLEARIGILDRECVAKVDRALKVSLALV